MARSCRQARFRSPCSTLTADPKFWETADTRLRSVMADTGVSAEITRMLIDTPEAADEHGFRGSLDVLLFNGHDPFAEPGPRSALKSVVCTELTQGYLGFPHECQLRVGCCQGFCKQQRRPDCIASLGGISRQSQPQ